MSSSPQAAVPDPATGEKRKRGRPRNTPKEGKRPVGRPRKYPAQNGADTPTDRSTQPKSESADAKAEDEADEDDSGRSYWLMKAEPESRLEKGVDVKFSIDDLASQSAFDPAHPYYDEKSSREDPKWDVVHVEFRRKFQNFVSLNDLKAHAKAGDPLENLQVLKQSRLSVSRVTKKEWDFILGLAKEKESSSSEGESAEETSEPRRFTRWQEDSRKRSTPDQGLMNGGDRQPDGGKLDDDLQAADDWRAEEWGGCWISFQFIIHDEKIHFSDYESHRNHVGRRDVDWGSRKEQIILERKAFLGRESVSDIHRVVGKSPAISLDLQLSLAGELEQQLYLHLCCKRIPDAR
ncbi:unnamed protein product [Aspergillus oryzae]|uniref:Unnamed protein product n=1 Tax=Aspergillus oryzae TaxID=5062 RepID=A0AAN4YZ24_ASPOZ|nr:unnamed protein product [Aspergillus oryzae]GMF84478.1 unnamed protein product [Aspergillus oryzae]GMG38754.1 unnamed protein product [Aspergillus oryzae]